MASTAPKLGATGTVTLDDEVFAAKFNEALVHECVRAELAARRQGTSATKTRGKVRGGGAKPWRQKGTGRARAGSTRSPVWRGGGTVFGPSPRHYISKVNKKARRAALRSVLSLHAGRESLAVLDAAGYAEPSTRTAAKALADWGRGGTTLVVVGPEETAAERSFRNIARTEVRTAAAAGIADLLRPGSLVLSESALELLTARAKGATTEAVA
jgi:large subunit ribosomal protein L4